jgi:hypothetical protein
MVIRISFKYAIVKESSGDLKNVFKFNGSDTTECLLLIDFLEFSNSCLLLLFYVVQHSNFSKSRETSTSILRTPIPKSKPLKKIR